MKLFTPRITSLVILAGLACCAGAQNSIAQRYGQMGMMSGNSSLKLVSLDTPAMLPNGAFDLRLDYRGFGGTEKQGYGTGELNVGLGQGMGVILRSTFSSTGTFNGNGFAIRHGGNDVEALLKYSVAMPGMGGSWAFVGGFAFPNTPAQKGSAEVAELLFQYPLQNGVDFYGGAKGVFKSNSNIAALCAGIDVNLGNNLHLIGDGNFAFTGENTYTTQWGLRARGSTYGAALRYNFKQDRSQLGLDLGVTNALGGSTGFSMTPNLGDTVGIYAALNVRF